MRNKKLRRKPKDRRRKRSHALKRRRQIREFAAKTVSSVGKKKASRNRASGTRRCAISREDKNKQLPVISLFSGALGLDIGLEKAGFQIRVAVECNRYAVETIRRNRPDITVIDRKLEDVTSEEILEAAGLRPGEPVVVTGGPCCQSFSTAGRRGSLGDPRGTMFRQFLRVVSETRPQFFVMENVHGLLSAAIRHRPLRERGPGFPPLEPEEELGSAFTLILKELKATGYFTVFDVLNTADFGVPQIRERIIFLGSRDGQPVMMPTPTHSRIPSNGQRPWVTLRRGLNRLRDPSPVYAELSPNKKKFLEQIPEGGNWRDLPPKLHAEALGGAFVSWGGRSGFFRRLAWDRPTPALTTGPASKATMLCHPSACRPLSVREYAKLQQFPAAWTFAGGIGQQYTQIGNAVPVNLGKAIAKAIEKAIGETGNAGNLGIIACANQSLLDRLAKRPITILNPARMRKVKDPDEVTKWLGDRSRHRQTFTELVSLLKDGQLVEKALSREMEQVVADVR
jgi:DNA (cytosine-5)-methyltransferase 1